MTEGKTGILMVTIIIAMLITAATLIITALLESMTVMKIGLVIIFFELIAGSLIDHAVERNK